MKQQLKQLIHQSLSALQADGVIDVVTEISKIQIERARDRQHGDYASNIAMALAKAAKCAPRALAEQIISKLPSDDNVEKVELAGPGFINFYLTQAAHLNVVNEVLTKPASYGQSELGAGKKVHLEYVSANPTGPLHVGHGRGAAFGSSLANVLQAAGFEVHREYYVNDAGRQMDILATSVWLRYIEKYASQDTATGFAFPINGYKGDYVFDIAERLHQQYNDKFIAAIADIFANLPADEPQGGDKEKYIDALINRAKQILGAENYATLHHFATQDILDDIKADLAEFKVEFDTWFSEKSLTTTGQVDRTVDQLQQAEHTFERDGALWFNAVHFGDEKDRVLRRKDGRRTYFASDAAYMQHKYQQGYDDIVYIFGADHHGYIARLKACAEALQLDPKQMQILLVQFAVLYRGEEKVSMSTRSGEFVTLRQLRDEVGTDAARFFYSMRKADQHMNFDLELAKSESADNPVYYIQYAHARICSVLRQLADKDLEWDQATGQAALSKLATEHEKALLLDLQRYPEVLEAAANGKEPHLIAHFLRELANNLHTYYNAHQFIVDDTELRNARLSLVLAVKQVLVNGLALLGVSAPEQM